MSAAVGRNLSHSEIIEGASFQIFNSNSGPSAATARRKHAMRSSLSSSIKILFIARSGSARNVLPRSRFRQSGAEGFDCQGKFGVTARLASSVKIEIAVSDL